MEPELSQSSVHSYVKYCALFGGDTYRTIGFRDILVNKSNVFLVAQSLHFWDYPIGVLVLGKLSQRGRVS